MRNTKNIKISGFSSPLRYPGGKTRFANTLLEAIEKNFDQTEKAILVEPYAGGAGASLALLFAKKVKKIVINDLDKAIFTFWKIAVSDTDYLINKIRRTEITIEEWKRQKAVYASTKSERKLAFATLFLNRTNRSGIMNGGPIGRTDQSGIWKVNARFTKKTIIARLGKIKEFCNKIEVYNLNGIELLKKIEERKNKNQYFIFLDPPYFQKGRSLYLNHYRNNDHENLSEFLEKSSFKKWVMTYDDVPYIKDLYATMCTKGFAIRHNAYVSRVGREVMIFPKEFIAVNI